MENNITSEPIIKTSDLLRYIKTNIIWILCFVIALTAAGYFYGERQITPVYKTNTAILVNPSVFSENSNSSDPVDYTSGLRAANTIASWIVDDSVITATIEELGIQNEVSKNGFKGMVSTSVRQNELWIDVTLYASNPEDAQIYLNTLIAKSIEMSKEIEWLKGTYIQPSPAALGTNQTGNSKRFVIIGFIAGLALGVVFAIIKGLYSTVFENEQDVENYLKLQVIGTLIDDKIYEEEYVGKLYPVSEINKNNFENLLTNIYFSNVDNNKKVIALSSTVQHEGKSSTVYNLANYAAIAGKKVLMIDLDLRKSTVHQYCNVERGLGVTDYATDQAKLEDIIVKMEGGFDAITAGHKAPDPTAILQSGKIAELISSVKEEYDYVFIDTTPVFLSDAKVISKLVDSVIYVVAAGSTKATTARDSLRELRRTDANILGAVVTRLKKKGKKYYYNYYYSDYHKSENE